jgi:hypothetical protein
MRDGYKDERLKGFGLVFRGWVGWMDGSLGLGVGGGCVWVVVCCVLLCCVGGDLLFYVGGGRYVGVLGVGSRFCYEVLFFSNG